MKLTTKQFGEKVGLTDKTIIQLIKDGTLPAEKFGSLYMIDDSYVQTIQSRPEKRGGGRKKKVNKEVAA